MASTKHTPKIARGSEQAWWWSRMLEGNCPSATRTLRGRARQFGDVYERSFANMLKRAEAQGYQIERTPGKLGGEWGATYAARLVNQEQVQ